MTVLTFPSNPVEGQRYDAPNEVQYVFDGAKWIVDSTSSSSEAVTDSVQDRVAPMFVGGDNEGISFTYDEVTNIMSATVTSTVPSNSLVNGLLSVTLESNGNITTPAFTIPNTAGTSGQVLKWPGSGSTLVWGSDNNTGVALPTNAVGVLTNNGSGTLSWVVPTAQVQSNWNATSGLGVILNKPTIPTSFDRIVNGLNSVTLASNGRIDFPNNVYIQGTTIGQDDTESTLNLYSAYGIDLSTGGGPMRLEVGASLYGPGENITILAGAGGEPGLDTSNGGNLYISAGNAGFNETSPGPTGGSVYISGGNAADGFAGNIYIQGGEGDGTTPGSIFVTSGSATEWEFKADKSLTFPTGGQIANYPGGVGASDNSWFVTPGGSGNGGVSSQDGQQYIQINNNLFVEIGTSYGTANESLWRFGRDGGLTFPDSTIQTTAWLGVSTAAIDDTAPSLSNGALWFNTIEGRLYIKYSDLWIDAAPLMMPAPDTDIDVASITFPDATVQTTAIPNKLVNGASELVLDEMGFLTVPASIVLSEGVITFMGEADPGIVLGSSINSVFVRTLNGIDQHEWKFGTDGGVTFPDNTVQTTAYTGGGSDATGVSRSDDNLIIRLTDPNDDGLELRSLVVDGNDMDVSSTVLGANGFIIRTNSNVSQKEWQFGNNGTLTFPTATVPEHSYGAAGDKAGMVAFDTTYIYYCTADYVDNVTDIWKRTAHSAGTW